jgi:hypothetical protein
LVLEHLRTGLASDRVLDVVYVSHRHVLIPVLELSVHKRLWKSADKGVVSLTLLIPKREF